MMRHGRDLNPRIEGFADLAIRPLWYRAGSASIPADAVLVEM